MASSRCHSFEEFSSIGHSRNVSSLSLKSRSESATDSGSVKLIEFATVNLPLLESPAASQVSLSQQPMASSQASARLRFKENKTAPPGRGHGRFRGIAAGQAARRAFGSPISPDRFIPKRAFMDASSSPYRVSKHPQQLSPQQRLLRRRLPGDDPFLPSRPRRPVTTPGAQRPIQPRRPPHYRPRLVTDSAVVGGAPTYGPNDFLRQVSSGAVWGVGGTSPMLGDSLVTVPGDTHSLSGRGTTAPVFAAQFLSRATTTDEQGKHESRLALALDIDLTNRLLETCASPTCIDAPLSPASPEYERYAPFAWKDSAWKKAEREHWPTVLAQREVVPLKPFRILDAPYLRDDFYCSILAYSFTSGALAVALAQYVYLWSEKHGVEHPPFGDAHPSNYVTSLAFSSENGGRSILAVARNSGQLSLWSIFDSQVRFELSQPHTISCVVFKQRTTRTISERFSYLEIEAEELAAGDEMGDVWYYSVEWSEDEIESNTGWNGCITLLAKISAHSQQICGLAWSPDERFFATGGNDNACLLFELHEIIPSRLRDGSTSTGVSADSSDNITEGFFPRLALSTKPTRMFNKHHIVSHLLPSWANPPPARPSTIARLLCHIGTLVSGSGRTVLVPADRQKYRLAHAAAVKAIAFAPWQPSLLATGGGSNDRAIHFYHTRTGACLATINVYAQVTSLIWSQTRREIVATFGYAQPEHPFRIAVFAWPSCAQIAVIPWGPSGSSWDARAPGTSYDCGRALWAVSYPGRPRRPASVTLEDADDLRRSLSPDRGRSLERSSERRKRREGPRMVRPKEKEGGMWCPRTMEEGCIIVASSDQTVKFHEVWTGHRKSTGTACGLLGGSDILEGMEGIEKCGSEVIR